MGEAEEGGLAATKLYLHDAATGDSGSLPGGTTISNTSPTNTATGASTNRSLTEKIGTTQTSGAVTASGTGQTDWFRRFLSQPVVAGSISGTFTYSGAVQMSNSGATHSAKIVVGLWRPGTGALVGLLYDQSNNEFSASGTTETAGTSASRSLTSQTAQDGDILVVEMWGACSRAGSTTYTEYYDGTTESSTSSNAAFLNFSQTLAWYVGPTATLSFAGSAPHAVTRALAGVASFAGATANATRRAVAGVLSFSGTVAGSSQHFRTLTAALSSAGSTVVRLATYSLRAILTQHDP